MENEEIIKEVTILIQKPNAEKALLTFMSFLEKDDKYDHLLRISQSTLARLKKVKLDERQNKITYDKAQVEYTKINDTVLLLLDDLEKNNLSPKKYESEKTNQKTKWNQILLLVGLGFALAGLAFLVYHNYYRQRPVYANNPPTPIDKVECPSFKQDSEFNILLLPFTGNTESVKPSNLILERLNSYQQKQDWNFDTEIFSDYLKKYNQADKDKARESGKVCMANMVIYGTAIPEEKTFITRFNLIDIDNPAIRTTGGTSLDTLRTISSIFSNGAITADIENTINIIFGFVANQNGHHDVAVEVLKEVKTTKEDSKILVEMVQADSYIAQDSVVKAIEFYDDVLTKNEQNEIALYNRGNLLYEEKRYMEAKQDFNTYLRMDSTKVDILVKRGKTFEKLKELDKAEIDFKKAIKLAPKNASIKNNLQSLLLEMDKQERAIASANTIIHRNPNNAGALASRGKANLSLGDNRQAIIDANTILLNNPKNVNAYVTKLKAYRNEKDSINVKKTIRLAMQNGVTKRELLNADQSLNHMLYPTSIKPVRRRRN